MKTPLILCVTVLGTIMSTGAEQFRTDINPALLYYQAFLARPDFEPADNESLWNTNWLGQTLPNRFGELMGLYDPQFKLVRQAAQTTVPCDWGIDMSQGMATHLPHLGLAKGVAQAARLRVMWALQQGESMQACEDLSAVFVLARNLTSDRTLISVLVQLSLEAIGCDSVAQNFGSFTPESLDWLMETLQKGPPQGTVASSVGKEEEFWVERTLRLIPELQRQNAGNDQRAMEGIRRLLGPVADSSNASVWNSLVQASGGTSEGVIKLLLERREVYSRLVPLMSLPYKDYTNRMKEIAPEMEKSPNPFVARGCAGWQRARAREFRIQVHLAMLQAAVRYKLHGESGFRTIIDPCGEAPFGFERFTFEGVDRGFRLRSAYEENGKAETLIFVEKKGTPFLVSGTRAGQAFPSWTPQESFQRRYGVSPEKK